MTDTRNLIIPSLIIFVKVKLILFLLARGSDNRILEVSDTQKRTVLAIRNSFSFKNPDFICKST